MNKKENLEKQINKRNAMKKIICKHCHEEIKRAEIAGLFLICPNCKKLVNGQYRTKE
jgi:uncharacterized CHY-type Zn-finger protein